jgi:hypothetical protein
MAFPHPPGLTPPEIGFICEMELVTIVPRQRLERLDLLGVSGPAPGLYANERWEHTQKESTEALIPILCRVPLRHLFRLNDLSCLCG